MCRWLRKAERRLAEAIGLGELDRAPHVLPEQVRKRRAAKIAANAAASARHRTSRPAAPAALAPAAQRRSMMAGAAA